MARCSKSVSVPLLGLLFVFGPNLATAIGARSAAPDVYQQRVEPGIPSVVSYMGLELHIPAGALRGPTTISVEPLEQDELPPLGTGLINATPGGGGFRLLPDGQSFEEEVRLTLPYEPTALPAGISPHEIVTYYFDLPSRRWLPIEKVAVDDEQARVTSTTTHFTDFINGVLVVPDHPKPRSFTPTGMADLPDADPGAEINLVGPPEGTSFGNAVLNYPIEIPPGREIEPDLDVVYNSGGENGWTGLGWDLSVDAIEVETRFGVPRLRLARGDGDLRVQGRAADPRRPQGTHARP